MNGRNEGTLGDQRARELADARAQPTRMTRFVAEQRLVRTWIDHKLMEDEGALQELAWVEYRYLTPLQRTELFTRIYIATYRKLYQEQHPDEDASKKQPCNEELVRNELSEITSLWKARVHADEAGIPYDVYLETVMRGHLVDDRWGRPPRPNQLYGKLTRPRLREAVSDQALTDRLCGSDWDRRFHASQYRGDPVQETALELIKGLVNGSDRPADTLAHFLCDRQALTRARAVELFGEAAVSDAECRSAAPVIQNADGALTTHVPSCIGNYWNEDEDLGFCRDCPAAAQCRGLTARVRDDLIRVTGSDNPRLAHVRRSNAERQRRHRARQKENPQRLGRRVTETAKASGLTSEPSSKSSDKEEPG